MVSVLLVDCHHEPGCVPRDPGMAAQHLLGQEAHGGALGQLQRHLWYPCPLPVAGEQPDGNPQRISSLRLIRMIIVQLQAVCARLRHAASALPPGTADEV